MIETIEDILTVKLTNDKGSYGVEIVNWKRGWTEPAMMSLWTDEEKARRVFDEIRKAVYERL